MEELWSFVAASTAQFSGELPLVFSWKKLSYVAVEGMGNCPGRAESQKYQQELRVLRVAILEAPVALGAAAESSPRDLRKKLC